ncbi:MAG: DegV family protein [Cellulosilyticaceae bacterium]
MHFIIATDSSCDLPSSFADEHNLHLFHITSTVEGSEIKDDLGRSYSHHDFYNALRGGSMPTTSQVNVFTFKEQFLVWAKAQTPVLYIGFSSGLSGTVNSAMIALNQVREEYPDVPIHIIDTLAASGGVGLLTYYACQLRDQGQSVDEVYTAIESMKLNMAHIFTVDDLGHLERGGRISHASAFVGTLLNIKPVLYVNNDGKLIPYQKCRGRKKALKSLVQHFESLATTTNQPIMITHGDCAEDAQHVADLLKEEVGISPEFIHFIGPAIGAHSGPGTVALFFLGNQRTPIL